MVALPLQSIGSSTRLGLCVALCLILSEGTALATAFEVFQADFPGRSHEGP